MMHSAVGSTLNLQPSVDDCGTMSEARERSPRAPHSRRNSPAKEAGARPPARSQRCDVL